MAEVKSFSPEDILNFNNVADVPVAEESNDVKVFDVSDFKDNTDEDSYSTLDVPLIIPEEQLSNIEELKAGDSGDWIDNSLGGLLLGNLENLFVNTERWTKSKMGFDTLKKYDEAKFEMSKPLLIRKMLLTQMYNTLTGTEPDGPLVNWETAEEQIGVTPDEWNKLPDKERVKQLKKISSERIIDRYNPNTDAALFQVARFTGIIADPLIAVSMTKIPALVAYGAAEATMMDLGEGEDLNLKNTAIGAGFGLGGGLLFKGGQKLWNVSQTKKISQAISDEMNMLAAKAQYPINPNATIPINLYEQAINNLGLDAVKLQNSFKINKIKQPKSRNAAIEALEKASQEKVYKKGGQNALTKGLDYIIEPISEGIKRISPRTFGKLKAVERSLFEDSHLYATMVDPFLRKAFRASGTFNKAQKDELWLKMANASSEKDVAGIVKFLHLNGGKKGDALVKDWKLYRQAMDDIHQQRVGAGNTSLEKIIGYSPRKIVNNRRWYNGAKLSDRTAIDKILKNKYGVSSIDDASEETLQKAVADLLKSTKPKPIQQAGSANARSREKLTAAQLDSYQAPWNATHKYIKESMEEVQRYKVFGTKNIAADGNMSTTISNFIAKELASKKINGNDVDSLQELLEARFINGPKQMNEHLRQAKDLGYMTLLGHPSNAIRQFGDLAASARENGILNAFKGVYATLSRGKMLTPKQMGLLDNVAEEFASDTATKRGVDAVFKYSGFRSVDALGKGALVNSSIYKAAGQLKSKGGTKKFLDEWSAILGGSDAAKAADDFKAFNAGTIKKPTPLMKDVAFIKLSKIQPVTLSEMPKGYLNNPNGRMMYMLQSFAMKHVNVIRQDVFKEFMKGSVTTAGGAMNSARAVKNALQIALYYSSANVGADMAIDLILGRDKKLEDTWHVNLYRATGFLSKYDVDQMARGGDIYEWASAIPVPPLDPVAKGVVEAVQVANNLARGRKWDSDMKKAGQDMWMNVPIIGRLMGAWLYD